MKTLFILLILAAFCFGVYNQYQQNQALKADLAASQEKITDLEAKYAQAQQALARIQQQPAQTPVSSALAAPARQPQPQPRPQATATAQQQQNSGSWMWQHASSLDAPTPSGRKH